MNVGRSVFASTGYEATSIEEVAARAGVSKPIVYEHFGSKEGLYASIVDQEMDNLVARVSEAISRGSARERFETAVTAFIRYVKDEPDGFAVLTRDTPVTTTRTGLTRVIDDLAGRVDDVFRAEFSQAGYDARVAPIYANALIGMVTQVGQWWAAEGRPHTVEYVARHVAALGWMGLRHLPHNPANPEERAAARAERKRRRKA